MINNHIAAAKDIGRIAKKMPTEAGYARFDTEKNERHHADRMWALALAVHAAGQGKSRQRKKMGVSVSIV